MVTILLVLSFKYIKVIILTLILHVSKEIIGLIGYRINYDYEMNKVGPQRFNIGVILLTLMVLMNLILMNNLLDKYRTIIVLIYAETMMTGILLS